MMLARLSRRSPEVRRAPRALAPRASLVAVLAAGSVVAAPAPAPVAPPGNASPGSATAAPGMVPPAPNSTELLSRLRDRVGRPGGLTSEAVGQRAVATSNEDRSRAADVESAEAEVQRANVGYYPKVTLSARYTRLSPITAPSLGTLAVPSQPVPNLTPIPATDRLIAYQLSFPIILDNYLLQANLTVPLSDYLLRIRQTHDSALSAQEAAEMSRQAARRTTAAQAKLAYYAWARVRLQAAVTAQSVEQSRRHLELARSGRDAGRTADVEVMRAESALASAELLDERTRNSDLLGEQRLRTLLHDSGGAPYEIGEDLISPMPAGTVPDPDALYAEALDKRPEMHAFERSEASLKAQRQATQSTGYPRLDAFGNAYLANPSPRIIPQEEKWRPTWDVGVQLVWSPNELGGADASVRSVDARRRKLDADRAAVKDALRDEIRAAVIATKEAAVAADTADRGLVAAEESYRVRRELFELGRATDVELIDAESDVLRARLEMIQARVDARVARVQLDHAVGRDKVASR